MKTHAEKMKHVRENAYHMSVEELADNGFDIDEYELTANDKFELATFQDMCHEDACASL